MSKHDATLVSEHEIGTCAMVDSLEESYKISCEHNDVELEDHEYFRQYVWNLIAMLSIRIDKKDDQQ